MRSVGYGRQPDDRMADVSVGRPASMSRPAASTVFFPPTSGERRDERDAREARAKVICGECGVRAECLDYALSIREPHGIWGGLNEHERAALLAPSAG